MKYEELEGFLSAEEKIAIDTLEGCGWEVLTETKIEDTYKKDGGRIRTFTLAGRYDIAVVCKKVDQLIQVEDEAEKASGHCLYTQSVPTLKIEVDVADEKVFAYCFSWNDYSICVVNTGWLRF